MKNAAVWPRKALSLALCLTLASADLPGRLAQAASVCLGEQATVSFARLREWTMTPMGRQFMQREGEGLSGLALVSPDTLPGRVVLVPIARRLAEADPALLARLEKISELQSPEDIEALLQALRRAKDASAKESQSYARMISRTARARKFFTTKRRELETLSAEMDALRALYGDDVFGQAKADVDAELARGLLKRAAKTALALPALVADARRDGFEQRRYNYQLGVKFGLFGMDEAAARHLKKAAYGGHIRAQYALARLYEEGRGAEKNQRRLALAWYTVAGDKGYRRAQAARAALSPQLSAKEVRRALKKAKSMTKDVKSSRAAKLWGPLNPFKPNDLRVTLADEPPLKFWKPTAVLVLAAFCVQFAHALWGPYVYALGGPAPSGPWPSLMPTRFRLALGVVGVLWMFLEWALRSARKWSFWKGYKAGMQMVLTAALWGFPFALLGIVFQKHDPVPAVASHFGGYLSTMLLLPLFTIFEEVIFRLALFGGLLQAFRSRLSNKDSAFLLAAGISSLLFAGLHAYYTPLLMVDVAIMGYFFCLSYYRSRWLWVPIAAHMFIDLYAVGVRALLHLFGVNGLW